MAFKTWQTGVHIQQDKMVAVSLTREKSGWKLRRWWQLPLAAGLFQDGKIADLQTLTMALEAWRQSLPHYHRVFLAFPAARTLQKRLSAPAVALRDSECVTWIGSTLARDLEMAPDALCFDYTQDTFSNGFQVTAAQNGEVATLLTLAKNLRLNLAAITPDAGSLANLLPFHAPAAQCIAWQDGSHWLWAMRHQWGRKSYAEAPDLKTLASLLALDANAIAEGFDPFECLVQCQPPLPEFGAEFTVAVALAMGETYA